MRNRNGCEHRSERTPNRSHFGRRQPKDAAADHAGRKAVQSEHNISAGVAVKATGNVPKRSTQQNAEAKVLDAGQPKPGQPRIRREWSRP